MPTDNTKVLTDMVAQWRAGITEQETVRAKIGLKIEALRRKIEAAQVILGRAPSAAAQSPKPAAPGARRRGRPPGNGASGETMAARIKRIIADLGRPAEHREIIAKLCGDAATKAKLDKNASHYYNTIADLKKRGEITKDGRTISLAHSAQPAIPPAPLPN